MHADIEPVSGILRVFGDDSQVGEPYEWSATVRWLKRDTIEICGVAQPVTMAVWRAIAKLARDESSGIKHVLIRRHGRVKRYSVKSKRNEE